MNRRCRRCFCMNNTNPHCINQNMLEKACDNAICPSASLRYLSQRFGMPDQTSKAILNDIWTEELVP